MKYHNRNQIPDIKNQIPKKMNDLENRCLKFAVNVRFMVKDLPYNTCNTEDSKQVIRSSGSIGANYIEANESLGDKDKLMRLKISRKESKETIYWLNILRKQIMNIKKTSNNILMKQLNLKKYSRLQ